MTKALIDTVILAVEDDPTQQHILKSALAIRGYDPQKITVVGSDAEFRATAANLNPDVVLLDNDFPVTQGVSKTTNAGLALMRDIDNGQVPGTEKSGRLMISGGSVTFQEAAHAGADLFLSKPYTIDKLKSFVESATVMGEARTNARTQQAAQGSSQGGATPVQPTGGTTGIGSVTNNSGDPKSRYQQPRHSDYLTDITRGHSRRDRGPEDGSSGSRRY